MALPCNRMRCIPRYRRTVGLLCLLSALYPPSVAGEEEYRAPSVPGLDFEIGRLDAAAVARRHPFVFLTRDEIEAAKSRLSADPSARAALDAFLDANKKHMEVKIEPLDESWWRTAGTRPWAEIYPEVFEHTHRKPMVFAVGASDLAVAWALTGGEALADRSIAMLMNLAPYSFEPEHYDVGMNYAIWVIHALRAYDLLFDRLGPDQRRRLDRMMTRAAWAVARNDVYWVENDIGGGINNHLAWHKTCIGLLGIFYERPDMIRWAMFSRRALVPLLEVGLLDHGLWRESSLFYHFTSIAPMLELGRCQARAGIRPNMLEVVTANGRTLKQCFDAMFDVLMPDTMIPPVGDAYGSRARLGESPIYEGAWAAWQDPRHAWLLSRRSVRRIDSLFSPPLPADPPCPPVASILLPEHGYAFLRSCRDAAYWEVAAARPSGPPDEGDRQPAGETSSAQSANQSGPDGQGGGTFKSARCAFLTFDRSDVHAHADKLSLMWFAAGRLLLPDVEARATVPHAFSSQIQRELNRGGLSQNTVMIDGQDQRYDRRMLRLREYRDLPEEQRVTAADEDGILYEGVRQMRTLAQTPDYLLDVFQVDCGADSRQIDWIMHMMDERATLTPGRDRPLPGLEPFTLPDQTPWSWLREPRSFVPAGPIELTWRDPEVGLSLFLLAPGAERVILCGYPVTDQPASGSVPMILVRYRAARAVFAAVWYLPGSPLTVTLEALPPREGYLAYRVTTDGRVREHLVPPLVPATPP